MLSYHTHLTIPYQHIPYHNHHTISLHICYHTSPALPHCTIQWLPCHNYHITHYICYHTITYHIIITILNHIWTCHHSILTTYPFLTLGSSNSFDGILTKLEAAKKRNGFTDQSLTEYIKTTNITNTEQFSSLTPAEQCQVMKTELLHKLDFLANYLPNNTLDQLMDDLGGPKCVAEVGTG